MKSIVKNITALLIVVITFTSAEFVNANVATADSLGTLSATEQAAQDEQMEKVLLYGFESDVNGVLEATFYNVIAYKTLNPAFESEKLVDRITNIAMNEDTHVVRYKAFLALSYMKEYDKFASDSDQLLGFIQNNDTNGTFQVIIDNLREQQVAANQ